MARLIAGTLASSAATGCSDPNSINCPVEVAVDRKVDVTKPTLDAAVKFTPEYDSWDDVACERLCYPSPTLGAAIVAAEWESCSLTLPVTNTRGEVVELGSAACKGTVWERCESGRPPLSRIPRHTTPPATLAAALAQLAQAELDSVVAFEELAAQLRTWRAPRSLIDRCHAAAEDERRHHATLAHLSVARGHAGLWRTTSSAPADTPLLAVARHNAVVGCVVETWSALMAHAWARTAESPELRATFATIADDETRHGQLAWDLHAWLMRQLSPGERSAVTQAQEQALRELPGYARRQAQLPAQLGGLADPEQAATRFARGLGSCRLAA